MDLRTYNETMAIHIERAIIIALKLDLDFPNMDKEKSKQFFALLCDYQQ